MQLFPFSYRIKLLCIAACSVLLNLNTINNEYALDDEMVLGKNMQVHRGINGIGTILSSDAYQGYFDYVKANTPLAGGRYRPLSIVTFALEDAFFGSALGDDYLETRKKYEQIQATSSSLPEVQAAADKVKAIDRQITEENMRLAPIRHTFQVLWFTLSMLVLFVFLHRYLLPSNTDIAFAASLLFVFHPIHTEVIANVKSRDEIFSLLFIILSCIFVFRYHKSHSKKDLAGVLGSTLLAMLSKEYAILTPIIAASALYFTQKTTLKEIRNSLWFWGMSAIVVVILLVRQNVVAHLKKSTAVADVLNDPFMYATLPQKIATKIAILNQYLKLLVFPYPLSSDYSYQHFPYLNFGNWQVWLSMLVWGGICFLTYKCIRSKHFLAFPLLFFIGFFMLVNNLLFDIGATMGERLIYHSSFGFCLIAAWVLVTYISNKYALYGALMVVLLPYGWQTIARNPDWKNDFTLFTRDVKHMSNSALTNGNAGAQYYNKGYNLIKGIKTPTHADTLTLLAYTDTAIGYLSKSVALHPRYVNGFLNLAVCYVTKNKIDSAIICWKQAGTYFSGRHPMLIENAGMVLQMGKDAGSKKDYAKAIQLLTDASVMDPGNGEIWTNLGGAYYMSARFGEAGYAFSQALGVNPNLTEARQGAEAAAGYVRLITQCSQDSSNVANWIQLARVCRENNFPDLSKSAFQQVLRLQPGNEEAQSALRH